MSKRKPRTINQLIREFEKVLGAGIEVIAMPGGNGTKLPFAVKIHGEYLRTKGGVARRFATETAARKAVG